MKPIKSNHKNLASDQHKFIESYKREWIYLKNQKKVSAKADRIAIQLAGIVIW